MKLRNYPISSQFYDFQKDNFIRSLIALGNNIYNFGKYAKVLILEDVLHNFFTEFFMCLFGSKYVKYFNHPWSTALLYAQYSNVWFLFSDCQKKLVTDFTKKNLIKLKFKKNEKIVDSPSALYSPTNMRTIAKSLSIPFPTNNLWSRETMYASTKLIF